MRDLLFVSDLVEALLLASEQIETLSGQAFNLGGGPDQTLSLLELFQLMAELHGKEPKVHLADWRAGDQRYYVSDFRRFQQATGWSPKVGVREGVALLDRWLCEATEAPAAGPRARAARPAEGGRMRCALVNPNWTFAGSVYFGCREPHFPLEFGYARALLEEAGHEVLLIDAQMADYGPEEIRARLAAFVPDFTAITTAPSYLFWRCPPPELRVPRELVEAVRDVAGATVAVGPHGSTSPGAALRKLGVEAVVRGECETVLLALAEAGPEQWEAVPSVSLRVGEQIVSQGPPAAAPRLRPAPPALAHRVRAPPSPSPSPLRGAARRAPVRKSRPRAAALIVVSFAPSPRSAIAIAAGRGRTC